MIMKALHGGSTDMNSRILGIIYMIGFLFRITAGEIIVTTGGAVMAPVITPEETEFKGRLDVHISCETEGAALFYTLDGREPTRRSIRYTGPFAIDSSVTVKARAFMEEYEQSDTVEVRYTNVDQSGPLIVRAILFRSDDDNPTADSLRIYFGEPAVWNPSDPVKPNRIFSYYQADYGMLQSALSGLKASDIVVVDDQSIILIFSNGYSPKPEMDSIGFLDTTDYIADLYGNTPHGGPPVPVELASRSLWKARIGVDTLAIGMNSLKIRFEITSAKPLRNASATVYDALGNVIKTMTFINQPEISKMSAEWDGSNRDGRAVGSGTYVAFITATDEDGQSSTQRLTLGLRR
ncbi:MAG: hypothetical protein GF401_03445 [Chitinivibrionales bacterium]|nr:hypothetical protein [Chitinivibrionales bacterium]